MREARRRSEATVEWQTEEVSAAPTTEQESDRAKRGRKRSLVPPPLMLFDSFAPVSSFSEKTASDLLLDRGKGAVPDPQVPGRNPQDPEGGQVPGVSLLPGKSGVDWYRCLERSGTQVPVLKRSDERGAKRTGTTPVAAARRRSQLVLKQRRLQLCCGLLLTAITPSMGSTKESPSDTVDRSEATPLSTSFDPSVATVE